MEPDAPVAANLLSRETDIRRDAGGRWWKGADLIDHPLLVKAFNSWLERAADGRYCLRNDVNWAYVAIEGAPIFVHAVSISGETVQLMLSDGRTEALDPATMRQDRSGALFCTVRQGTMAAQFDGHAAVQLAPLIHEDDAGVYLSVGGMIVRPPTTDNALLDSVAHSSSP